MADKLGNKTGGRQRGTPNKRSLECAAMLEANGFDPDLPWIYWARVLKSHLHPVPKRGTDKAEQFYQGREMVSDGKDLGSHYDSVWARATADMADKAAKELARYIRPQLMRVQGTGSGGALLVEFAEDHRNLAPAEAKGQKRGTASITARVQLTARKRVKPL